MAVKVGNSYVSEAAYAYAKANAMSEAEDGKGQTDSGGVLKDLTEKFPDMKFSMGTKPFGGSSVNNMSIAPNILRQMATDPEKKLEYEALIYDCASLTGSLSKRKGLVSFGWMINSDGSLGAWSISKSGGEHSRSLLKLDKKQKSSWESKILESLKPKQAAKKNTLGKKAAIKQDLDVSTAANRAAVKLEISAAGKNALLRAKKIN